MKCVRCDDTGWICEASGSAFGRRSRLQVWRRWRTLPAYNAYVHDVPRLPAGFKAVFNGGTDLIRPGRSANFRQCLMVMVERS